MRSDRGKMSRAATGVADATIRETGHEVLVAVGEDDDDGGGAGDGDG
jgi:hypothetical protein